MTISEELQKTIRENGQKFADQPSFQELSKFYAEMESKGLVIKKTYDLPQLDTIGRSAYNLKQSTQKLR
jgi:hypothetical protein